MSNFTCVVCGNGFFTNRGEQKVCLGCEQERPIEVKNYHLGQRLRDAEEVIALILSERSERQAAVDKHYSQDYYKEMKYDARPLEQYLYALGELPERARE